ncbi:DNA phosphorothioation-dependent restriction protein DptG [Vibrio viridaestus]|uniref:DNA phosphorothioation-dependent restriction protein DptG n=1 Tax=Vibrio viridaestus TaxID=2487322 RepID=A0A3N9TFX4_9VIBR|nr:DNA phosphorothioation-dependent restriction protein DptG [Vibrio viridaestus]RQW62375.1 DNA phosphorothioation-dependent restriction protein DptG [Vibrio viridaestus]
MDNFSLPFNADLPVTKDKVANKNSLNSFLPIRTKGNDFDWSVVIGLILGTLIRKKIDNYDYVTFKQDCQDVFESKLGRKEFWTVLDKMYFEDGALFSVSPETLLFKSQKEVRSKSDERIASLFTNLLQELRIKDFDTKLNFLENEILTTLRNQMREESFTAKELPYLPFLSACFRKDLQFLSEHPKYLLAQIQPFLSLYGFIYVAQLSLVLPDWRKAEAPESKPLYFIMDHERASSERVHVRNHGYKLFEDGCYRLFPYLTMLEMLQPEKSSLPNGKKLPLWQLAQNIQESQNATVSERLALFAKAFKANRNLDMVLEESDDAFKWLDQLLKLSVAQFEDKTTERPAINRKYVAEVEKYLASGFVHRRGRAGRVLVLNQEYLLLLANLAIGKREKIRFQELVGEFKARGVFLDKQTELELIKFFERIGNVEKMSDSGDAVYVRKTI